MRILFGTLLVVLVGCAEGATVDPDDPMYERWEAPGFDNACSTDSDCVVGGCSSEVCAAEPVVTTCEVVDTPPGECGCLQSECVWQSWSD